MANNTPFPARQAMASAQLPLQLIALDDWALVSLQGADAISYLQGQVTVDVAALDAAHHQLCAHCDAKGKMWSTLRLFHRGAGLAFIERRSLRDRQLTELKKYAVFSKVTISADDDTLLFGVAGAGARTALAGLFTQLPDATLPVVQQQQATLLHFALPSERFLLLIPAAEAQTLIDTLAAQAQLSDSAQWLALDIEAGYPVIDEVNSAQFIPQATNLQALDAISFTKGCYTGQEMVARAKYRGANKRALYWLAGSASRVPAAGEDLELRLGDNWRRTGTVLAALQLASGEVWVQAVLNNDLEADTLLRVRDDAEGQLRLQSLPYSLAE